MSIPIFSSVRKKIEKNFWDMEIIGNRRKKNVTFEVSFSCTSGFKSENVEGFSNLPKNIPKNYLKVHPVQDIDKTSIIIFFDCTSLIYLQVLQKA